MDLLKRRLLFCPGEEAIAASCAGVQAHLGLSDAELRKMVVRLPSIISLNFEAIPCPPRFVISTRRIVVSTCTVFLACLNRLVPTHHRFLPTTQQLPLHSDPSLRCCR